MQLFEHKLAREGYRQEYKQHHMQARNQDELCPERLLAGFVAQPLPGGYRAGCSANQRQHQQDFFRKPPLTVDRAVLVPCEHGECHQVDAGQVQD